MKTEDLILDVEQSVDINGTAADVFKSVLNRLGEGNIRPDGEPLHLRIEPFAGGRWYRDRGEGIQHLWGHVQVIKPGELLELSGPMFMSYPAINHVEVKLSEIPDGTKVTLRHRAVGIIDPEHRENVSKGWQFIISTIEGDFPKAAGSQA